MRVVVDASMALDAFTTTLGSTANRVSIGLLESIATGQIEAFAPDHFAIECANAVRRYQLRNHSAIKPRDALKFLESLSSLPIELAGMAMDPHTCASWAYAMNCGAYDAVYIELARQLDAQVATSDRGMRAACVAFKVPLWEPSP